MIFRDIKNIHFVGIGGIGMSGIAEVLAASGFDVSGCDQKSSAALQTLAAHSIPVSVGHSPDHLDGVDAVVVTAAVRGQNPEVDAAKGRGIRVFRRSEVLGALVNEKRSIGISGTHGKTTTSAMMAMVLEEAGLDPTVLIGGVVQNIGTNAKVGTGEFLVVEADEYDRTFHHLHPEVAIVTNIEADHLEYYGSIEAITEAFRIYLDGIRPGGTVIACADDPAVRELLPRLNVSRVIRYGLGKDADLRAVRVRAAERGSLFDIERVGAFRIFVPGEHNVRNALAAIAAAEVLGIDYKTTAVALAKFLGVDRRFQILGTFHGAMVVDDYAHHPTEIQATLDAARRGYPDRRIVALFQPHLYSRTRDFAVQFAKALMTADVALVAPIFAAREEPMTGITARTITDAGEGIEFLDRSNREIAKEMRSRLQPNDLFITMGAGDVHEIAEALAGELV